MQTPKDSLNNSLKKEIINTFFQTLEDIKTKSDFEIFFKDFFSDAEIETYAKRLATAYWLKKNRSQENIKTNLKVNSKTIIDIQNKLNKPGYKLALKKMEAEEWANVWSEKIKKLSNIR